MNNKPVTARLTIQFVFLCIIINLNAWLTWRTFNDYNQLMTLQRTLGDLRDKKTQYKFAQLSGRLEDIEDRLDGMAKRIDGVDDGLFNVTNFLTDGTKCNDGLRYARLVRMDRYHEFTPGAKKPENGYAYYSVSEAAGYAGIAYEKNLGEEYYGCVSPKEYLH